MQLLWNLRCHMPYGAIKVTLNVNTTFLFWQKTVTTIGSCISADTRKCEKECAMRKCMPILAHKNFKGWFWWQPVQNVQALFQMRKNVSKSPLNPKRLLSTCRVCEYKCVPGAWKSKSLRRKNLHKSGEMPWRLHRLPRRLPIKGRSCLVKTRRFTLTSYSVLLWRMQKCLSSRWSFSC